MTTRIAFCTACHTGSRYRALDEPCASCGRKGLLSWEDPGQLELIPTKKERKAVSKKNGAGAIAEAEASVALDGETRSVEALVASDVRTFATFAPTALEPDPRNPRGPVNLAGVEDLLPKIKALGQKVPCLVRPIGEGRHMIVLGHRRTFIAEHLGHDVPCVVEKMSDDHAVALMLAEHDSQKHFRPFAEAEAIAELVAKGWNFRQVSDALGKPVRWVALRSNLKNLSPKIRAHLEKRKLNWPVEWLEDLARLTVDSQEQLLKGDAWQTLDYVHDQESLDRVLGKQFHVLGKATWDLADGTLVPKAGACVTCPKTSLRAPGLFDNADADPESPKALKAAVCRDAVCWQAKCDAVQKQKIAELRKEHPKAPVVKKTYSHAPTPKGLAVKELNYRATVSEPKKGAENVAILIEEDGTPKLVSVKEPKSSSSKPKADPKKAPAKGEDPKKALAASRKEIEARRESWILGELGKRIATSPAPEDEGRALAVVAAYGFVPAASFEGDDWLEIRKGFAKKLLDGKASVLSDFLAIVWSGVVDCAADEASFSRKKGEEVRWLAELVGVDVPAVEAKAIEEIPDPKWWGKAETAESPAGKAKAARAGKAPKKVSGGTPVVLIAAHFVSSPNAKTACGVKGSTSVTTNVDFARCGECTKETHRECRGCGRTAFKVALDGGSWEEPSLCDACGGNEPAGKKKSKKGSQA